MPDITKLAKMLRKDLEGAGIAYRDEHDCVVDFHALRHTYATNLARSGVHPKIAMDLLGHSDINLTMAYYAHTDVKERGACMDSLPKLVGEEDKPDDREQTPGRKKNPKR